MSSSAIATFLDLFSALETVASPPQPIPTSPSTAKAGVDTLSMAIIPSAQSRAAHTASGPSGSIIAAKRAARPSFLRGTGAKWCQYFVGRYGSSTTTYLDHFLEHKIVSASPQPHPCP